MMTNIAVVLLLAVCCVSAQTFQYSRGWTNGKRGGIKRDDVIPMERPIDPCQLKRLKYLLDGRPLDAKFYAICDLHDNERDSQTKSYKAEHNPEQLFEVFQ